MKFVLTIDVNPILSKTIRYPYKGSSWAFFKLGLAQSRQDPLGIIKKLETSNNLIHILFEFSRQNNEKM